MTPLEKEALRYELPALEALQKKRLDNLGIFEDAIRREREAMQHEEMVMAALQQKRQLHESRAVLVSEGDYAAILADLPKLQSTLDRRAEQVKNLKAAIIEEQEMMDREERMIAILRARQP